MIGIIIAAVFVFLGVCSIAWTIGTYNVFIAGKQHIKNQWANILTEYQRRADLFYNLVQAVKSHKKFEASTLKEVIQARNGNFGNTQAKQSKKMDKLDGVFSKLLVVFERYPELKAIEQYNKLSDEVRITEDRINVARTDYNGVVKEYNLSVKTFPNNLLANMFKFVEEKFFVNEKDTSKCPKIKLD